MGRRQFSVVALFAVLAGCGGAKTPAAPTVTSTSVTVGTAGNASTTLGPGDTRQLFATAAQSNGTTIDVTNLAVWQSSAPQIATVSPSGLLTAAAEGSLDVSATYNSVRGSLHADVRATCTVTVSPAAAAYNAFGGSATITVAVNSPSCRWSARSDAGWFPFVFDPASPGNGSFSYTLPPNSTTSARTASVTVETSTGLKAAHAITEDKPLGCSYVAQPEEVVFTAAGGSGQFNVIATPSDCRWTVLNGLATLGVRVTGSSSGTGNGLVRYLVDANARTVDTDGFLEISGLSGLNPNGRHHIVILKR